MPSSSKPEDSKTLPENPQSLIGFMTNDEWDELLAYVNDLIEEMEALPLPDVKDKVFELLAGIDSIHREGLWRLVRLFKEGVLEQVITDPAIHTLMELYDLLPPENEDDPEQTSEKPKISFPNIPIKVMPMQKEETPKTSMYPHWVPALKDKEELESGTLRAIHVDDRKVILCRVENQFFVLSDRCAQDGTSLEQAKLSSYTLSCPNHPGCHYDIRQGTRIAGVGEIKCYPVNISDDGSVMIGIDMVFTPKLPTF
jgi:nitrite reductase/ring-hydroxylating ferredoxin subunit/predicted DNA-binding protein (UPF0251 family)